jgi:hypothetical protein
MALVMALRRSAVVITSASLSMTQGPAMRNNGV